MTGIRGTTRASPPRVVEMDLMRPLSSRQIDGVLGGVVALVTILLLGTLVLPGSPMAGPTALRVLVERGWPAGLWLLAALGLGTAIEGVLLPSTCTSPSGRRAAIATPSRNPLRIPLGVAAMIVLDLTLGGLGLLGRGHEAIAWAAVLVPAGIAVGFAIRSRSTARSPTPAAEPPADPWRLAIPLGIPIGVLLLAATSTPGWLWASEFGGYDALSYHLQLPREWWFAGGIVETPHNAYGYLPGGGSAAFLHLMTLVGDPAAAAITCQILVALLTIAAADAAAIVTSVWFDGNPRETIDIDVATSRARLAMMALLATPWVVVTGSLAYDEAMVMIATAAAAVLVLRIGDESPSLPHDLRRGAGLGLVLAAAVLAKASSGVLVVLPIAAMTAVFLPPRRWPAIAASTAVVGVLACLPWLVRDATWTGNPVFPFATRLFGAGDWTPEQVARFADGHASPGGGAVIVAVAREFLLDDLLGGLPPGEPGRPQWLALPLLGLASLGLLLRSAPPTRRRSAAVLAAVATAIVAWMFLTHAKARFLLAIAPLLAAAVGLAGLEIGRPRHWTRLVVAVAAWLAPLGPVLIFVTEKGGAPAAAVGADEAFDGRAEAAMIAAADPRTARELRADASRAFILRDLPDDARVLLVGIADPFHLGVGRDGDPTRLGHTTVWTRGPLERAFAAAVPRSPNDAEVGPDPDRIATAALDALRAEGFTHVLVAPTMLEIWRTSGWLDPELTPERIAALTAAPGTRIAHRFRDGGVLLSITSPDREATR